MTEKFSKLKNITVGWDVFQLSVSLLLAILAFIVSGIWAESLKDKNQLVEVIVANEDLSSPTILTAKNLANYSFKKESLPKNYLPAENSADLVGVTLIHPLSKGEMITTNDIIGKIDPALAGFSVPRNAKGLIFPASWSNAPLPNLKKGDTVTIFYGVKGSNDSNGILAKNIPVSQDSSLDGDIVSAIYLVVPEEMLINLLKLQVNQYTFLVSVDGIAPESNQFKK